MNSLEKFAEEIVRKWIEKHGNFTVQLEDNEPSLIVKLLTEVLVEFQKTADANEMSACRHERTLVAEELYLLLSVIGVGPENRHSPSNKYSDEDCRKLYSQLMETIGNGVPAPSRYEIDKKLNEV